MFLKKSGDGSYYVYKKATTIRGRASKDVSKMNNIFFIKDARGCGCVFSETTLYTPKELIGKRIMLKVLVIEG